MDKLLESRNNYVGYKFLGKSVIGVSEYVSVQVLSYLDRLGFSMEDMGTYMYKELILSVVEKMKMASQYGDSECLQLISWLANSDSDLYRVLASNLGISLDKLVLSINNAICKINYDLTDQMLFNTLCEEDGELSLEKLTYDLASMVLGYKREKRNNKIKIKCL